MHDAQRISVTTLVVAALLVVLYLSGLTQAVDRLSLSAWFRLRGVGAVQDNILLVKLDQDFVDQYGFRIGELDRGFYARALENLSAAGARVIGVDLFFPERSVTADGRNPDMELAAAVLGNNVILPQVRSRSGPGGAGANDHVPFNPLLRTARRGVLNLDATAYEISSEVNTEAGTLPSFALAVLRAGELPGIRTSGEYLIDYRGPAGTFPALSFLDVYRNQFSYSDVQDKVVLLGVTLAGTDQDQVVTPFGLMSGLEVSANAVYTLLHGRLAQLPAPLYALLLLSGVAWTPVTRRKWGLAYALAGVVALFGASLLLFWLAALFVPPLWLALLPLVAYLSSSYRHLKTLDVQLSQRLSGLLDAAMLARPSDVSTGDLSAGFAPRGYAAHAPEMLESLLQGLGGESGLLLLNGERTAHGEVSPLLVSLLEASLSERRRVSSGTLPYAVAQPVFLDEAIVGAVALGLPAPLPPHLLSLLETSAGMFSQLARYQRLRERTETLADTLWPWRTQSSLTKLNSLAMIGDLLATERSWLGSLLETLPQATFIMSPYGYSVFENASARRLFSGEKNMLRALPGALQLDAERFQKDYVTLVEQGEELELGLVERGSGRPVLLSLRVVRDAPKGGGEGEVRGVAGIVNDLSKVEEMARQRQELIGVVVHDLRSPLTSIQGFADLLLEGDLEDTREPLSIIRQEAARMQRLTDTFLDVVKLESDAFDPERTLNNVAELLRYAVAAVSTQAAQKEIVVEVDAPPFLEALVDPDMISRLMSNLLSNAVKYSPAATRVTVKLQAGEDEAILSVQDEGYGMSEELRSQLFQKYRRAPSGKARAVKGTGLGLYLVKLIVDAHDGTVEVASKLDKGSTFTVRLPLALEELNH